MSLAVVPLISSIFNLVREGKQTVDEVVSDPAVQESANKFSDQVIAETMQGDTFTKRARPTLIYIAALALFNDLIIAPYVDVFTSEDVTVLTGDKFYQLIYLLMALGVARSVNRIRLIIPIRLGGNVERLTPINRMQDQVGGLTLAVLGGHFVRLGRGRCEGVNEAN